MAYTLRPMSVGELLDAAFDLYRRNFALFVGISFFPHLALLVLRIMVILFVPFIQAGIGRTMTVLLVGSSGLLAMIAVKSVVTAATTFAVSDLYLDAPTTVRKCFSRLVGRSVTFFYTTFAFFFIIILGLVMLVVPGVYWAGKYSVAVSAVVLEGGSGTDALRRSERLTDGFLWRMSAIYFLWYLLVIAISRGMNYGFFSLLGFAHMPGLSRVLSQVAMNLVVGTFLGPIGGITMTLAYYDLRIRKEGFDLERMMALLDVPPPPPPPPLASGASVS